MVPPFFIPGEWLLQIQALSRPAAIGVLLVALSTMGLGLRYARFFAILAVAALGWYGGALLSELMHVTPWYVAVPAALLAAFIARPLSHHVLAFLIAFVGGCLMGSFLTWGLRAANFWMGFGIGVILGVALGYLAQRFSALVVFSGLGTAAALAALGSVVRSGEGPFAPGGYAVYPKAFMVVGVLLFLISVFAQVALDPQSKGEGLLE